MAKLVDARFRAEYYIVNLPASIGRHSSNSICLAAPALSRFHAEIGMEMGQHYIEDLGSTHGTFVNGRRVDGREPVFDGDRIGLASTSACPDGDVVLVFSEERVPEKDAAAILRDIALRPKLRPGTVEWKVVDDTCVFCLAGVFRGPECDEFAKSVAGTVAGRRRDVVVDLSDVTHMNSYALGTFVKTWSDLRDLGLDMALAKAGGRTLELLEMVGLTSRMGHYRTVMAAIDALRDRRQVRRP